MENPRVTKRCDEAVQILLVARFANEGIRAEFISAIEIAHFMDVAQNYDEEALGGKHRTNPFENLKAVHHRHF